MSLLDEKKAATNIISDIIIPHPAAGPDEHPDQFSTVLEPTDRLSRAPTAVSPDGRADLNPFSPFYDHSPTRLSLETQGRYPITTMPTIEDTDLETGTTPLTSACSMDKPPLKKRNSNFHCSVWPGREAMRMRKKAMRRERARYRPCGWMAGLRKPVRIWIKVAMAMVLAGAAVGIAIGISKAVGGGVWRNDQSTNVPIGSQRMVR